MYSNWVPHHLGHETKTWLEDTLSYRIQSQERMIAILNQNDMELPYIDRDLFKSILSYHQKKLDELKAERTRESTEGKQRVGSEKIIASVRENTDRAIENDHKI